MLLKKKSAPYIDFFFDDTVPLNTLVRSSLRKPECPVWGGGNQRCHAYRTGFMGDSARKM